MITAQRTQQLQNKICLFCDERMDGVHDQFGSILMEKQSPWFPPIKLHRQQCSLLDCCKTTNGAKGHKIQGRGNKTVASKIFGK